MKISPKVIFLFIGLFLFFFISRSLFHFNLKTDYYDQYFFDNPFWNTTQGNPLFLSVEGRSFLGNHFSPILFLFTLPYFIHPSPLWIFAIQALFVAGIATLIFSFAGKQLDKSGQKLILFLLFTNATFRYMGFHDFHMDVVLTFLLTSALYLLLTQKDVLFSTLLILSGFLAKESAGFVVASYGIFFFFFRKNKFWGTILFLGGIVGAAYIAKEIIPVFNPKEAFMFSKYYAHFGNNIYEQMLTILLHPFRTFGFIFSGQNLFYFFILLAPFAFLPLFAPSVLTIGFLPFLQNLLSNYRFQKDFTTQYSYVLIPILFYATILGIKKIQEKNLWEKHKPRIKRTVVFFAVLSILAFFLLDLRLYLPSPGAFSAHKIMRMIPPKASLSASTHLFVHLQYRNQLALFPEINKADYVIYEDVDWWLIEQKGDDSEKLKTLWGEKRYGQILYYLFMGAVIPEPKYVQTIKSLKENKKYTLLTYENGIYLYKRI